jgi:ParB family chromosome partitioning protein
MSLKGKAAKIDLNLAPREPVPDLRMPSEVPAVAAPLESGPARRKSGVSSISQSIGTMHRMADLEEEVAVLRAGQQVLKLDPKLVRQSRWRNRSDGSFTGTPFADLKAEIAEAGENVVAIKVRRLASPAADGSLYEIIYGRRRLRACLELGLPVAAIVVNMTDEQAFIEAERENRHRADLTPWEQGVFYADALREGLFASQRQMAQKLGVTQPLVSAAVRLASLPEYVVDAFASPLDLQYRWGADLAAALEKDPARVQKEALEIASTMPRPSAKAIVERLTRSASKLVPENANVHQFKVAGKTAGTLTVDASGAITLRLRAGVGKTNLADELRKLVSKNLE